LRMTMIQIKEQILNGMMEWKSSSCNFGVKYSGKDVGTTTMEYGGITGECYDIYIEWRGSE